VSHDGKFLGTVQMLKKAALKSFNSSSYLATFEIAGSGKAYLEGVPVAKSIDVSQMVNGRNLVLVFFDEHNVRDAVVIAVY
jgi:hypothetical protein